MILEELEGQPDMYPSEIIDLRRKEKIPPRKIKKENFLQKRMHVYFSQNSEFEKKECII